MKVILLDNIRGVGQVGDVKDVSDGYGRNFLLPHGKAKIASPGALRDVAAIRDKRLATLAQSRTEAEAVAKTVQGTVVELSGKANEQGTLFAAVTAADIAQALTGTLGLHLEAGQVALPEPLKSVGDHSISIEFAEGVTAQIVVSIKAA